jgi:hypothetical protein
MDDLEVIKETFECSLQLHITPHAGDPAGPGI